MFWVGLSSFYRAGSSSSQWCNLLSKQLYGVDEHTLLITWHLLFYGGVFFGYNFTSFKFMKSKGIFGFLSAELKEPSLSWLSSFSPSQPCKLIDPENLQHILWHNRSALASVKTGHLRLLEGGWGGMSMTVWLGCRKTKEPGQAGGRGVLTYREKVTVITHRSSFHLLFTSSRNTTYARI